MRLGRWIPLSKNLLQFLPKDRPYSKVEAAFSVQMNYDRGDTVTLSGYAELWRWNRKTVAKFLSDLGAVIVYPQDTKKLRNQRGHIAIQKRDINGTLKGHIRLIDSKWLDDKRDIKETNPGQQRDNGADTIKDPLDPEPDFIYSETSNEYKLSLLLFKKIQENDKKFPDPNLQDWSSHIDKLLNIDKRSPQEITEVIIWSQASSFWKGNILSTSKLRARFPELYIKMKSDKPLGDTFSKNTETAALAAELLKKNYKKKGS